MKLEQFTEEKAEEVLKIWARHLGKTDHMYFQFPSIFSERVRNRGGWMGNVFQDRIGSRYSDNSKINVGLDEKGDLTFGCYLQANFYGTPKQRKRPEYLAKKAAERFEIMVKHVV